MTPSHATGVAVGLLLALTGGSKAANGAEVVRMRTPDGGIAPQATTGTDGTVHLIYLKPAADGRADILYVRSDQAAEKFSSPVRVNSQPLSAMTARHPRITLGKAGRVHVVWNGARGAQPRGPLNPAQPADNPHNGTPLLYARLNDDGSAFEPQRNLMRRTHTLDGGGAIAADGEGNVYAVWQAAAGEMRDGEQGRRVWVARSTDDGKTFGDEALAWDGPTGACGCCHVSAFADKGGVYVLYRGAQTAINRDMYLLASSDGALTFRATVADRWRTATCPMSTPAFARTAAGVGAAWETEGRVVFATVKVDGGAVINDRAEPAGKAAGRKMPVVATNARGESVRAWTEGMAWKRGGAAAWELIDQDGKPTGDAWGSDGVPPDGAVAAFARPDGTFVVMW